MDQTKKPGQGPGKSRGPTKVKTFQRERPTRQRGEEESDTVLKPARVYNWQLAAVRQYNMPHTWTALKT
jgi:hypothetical protein